MILHEKIHASQYHSVDIILAELVTAIMWFNPVVWLVKKSMLQVHEYLADEGVLSAGFDRLNYQTLLVNQLIEEKAIVLSSNFSSLIKKRMIMLKLDKTRQKSRFKILSLIPISLALFMAIAFLNGLMPNPVQAETKSLKSISNIGNYHPDQIQNLTELEDTSKRTRKKPLKKSSKEIVADSNNKDTLKEIKVASIPIDSTNVTGNMVYIVDGVYVANIYNIPVETIESVNILKEDNLMVIRTKNFARKKPSFKVKSEMNDLSSTQIYIDGVEQPFGFNVENLRNDDIESINVVKDLSLSKSILYITTKHVLNFQH
jgi:hypothetical protein